MIHPPPHSVERSATISLYPHWHRISLGAIVLLTAALNFLNLAQEGYGNTYYAAAVRSMMQNWHAFFFNSLDPAGFVSIDKPPLGFWLQVASAKIFGFNGVALMLPQALAGVGSVALLYYLVNRSFGRPAGLIAALVLALTPISVVTSRNNLVDGTLVFCVLLGAWAVSRAVETGKLRWLLLAAVFVGLGFNVKMLQAFLVLPAFGLMYLLGARIGWGRRLVHLFAATAVLLVVSLSWVTAVDLTPASQRPWVGSTTDNSELTLAIGYNGLQRLTGNSSVGGNRGGALRFGSAGSGAAAGSLGATQPPGGNGAGPGGAGGGPGGVGENGPTGVFRLLDAQLGAQIGWLLALAVIGIVVAAWQTRRRWPLSTQQSALVLWGTWLLTTAAFFSVAGFFHTYYLVMTAPAIAALSGIGLVSLWQVYSRRSGTFWPVLPLGLLVAAAVQVRVLATYPSWSHWLSPLIAGSAVLAALVLIAARVRLNRQSEPGNSRMRIVLPAFLIGLASLLVGPAVWSVGTVSAANSGLTPVAGPSGTSVGRGFGGPPNGTAGNFPPAGFRFAPPVGAASQPPSGGTAPVGSPSFQPSGGPRGIGAGGIDRVNAGLVRYLEQHQGSATYLFATTNAGTAEPYIISTGKAVMATGGFTGSDPILTTSKLRTLIKHGTVRFFLIGGMGGPGGDSSATSWVQSTCRLVPTSVYRVKTGAGIGGGQSLYDCATAK